MSELTKYHHLDSIAMNASYFVNSDTGKHRLIIRYRFEHPLHGDEGNWFVVDGETADAIYHMLRRELHNNKPKD